MSTYGRLLELPILGGDSAATAPTINSAAPPDPVVGVSYSHTFTASGTAPITFAVQTGSLPAGLSLDGNTGVLSGTPTTEAAYSFTIRATNSAGTNDQPCSVTVRTAPSITSSLPGGGTVGASYTHTFTATGTSPITWSVISGSLPAGLSLDGSTGVLSGTPTTAASYSFTVQASNAAGAATQACSVTIASGGTVPTITSAEPADPVFGSAYTHTFTATGTSPITWSVQSGSLPAGLSLDSGTGVLSGTPTAVVVASFTVRATNAHGTNDQATSVTVTPSYDLRVEFATDDAAPLAATYSGEVGSITSVQTDGNLSTSGGLLSFPVQATPAAGDQGFYSASTFARAAGRALLAEFTLSTLGASGAYIGWGSGASVAISGNNINAFLATSANTFAVNGNITQQVAVALSTSTTYQVALVFRSTGAYLYIKGGIYSDWFLLWSFPTNSSTPLRPFFSNVDNAGTLNFVRTALLGGIFGTDFGAATFNVTSFPMSDQVMNSSSQIHYVFTLPGSPVAGDKVTLQYAIVDASNRWEVYLLRNAGNTNWDFRVDSVVAGVATNRINVAGIGDHTELIVRKNGNLHDFWTVTGTTTTKRGSQLNFSTHSSGTGVQVAGVGTATRVYAAALVNTAVSAALNAAVS
jgi:hypothetical protein